MSIYCRYMRLLRKSADEADARLLRDITEHLRALDLLDSCCPVANLNREAFGIAKALHQ